MLRLQGQVVAAEQIKACLAGSKTLNPKPQTVKIGFRVAGVYYGRGSDLGVPCCSYQYRLPFQSYLGIPLLLIVISIIYCHCHCCYDDRIIVIIINAIAFSIKECGTFRDPVRSFKSFYGFHEGSS